jgi:hypothetical protein
MSHYHDAQEPELPRVPPLLLFMVAGFDAKAGFPLPDGRLPVSAPVYGVVSVSPAEWQGYLDLCAGERLAAA